MHHVHAPPTASAYKSPEQLRNSVFSLLYFPACWISSSSKPVCEVLAHLQNLTVVNLMCRVLTTCLCSAMCQSPLSGHICFILLFPARYPGQHTCYQPFVGAPTSTLSPTPLAIHHSTSMPGWPPSECTFPWWNCNVVNWMTSTATLYSSSCLWHDTISMFFQCLVSIVCAHLDFRQCIQGMDESAAEFITALRELAPDCHFTDPGLQEMLMMQILTSCHSSEACCQMLLHDLNADNYEHILQTAEQGSADSVTITTAQSSGQSNSLVSAVQHASHFQVSTQQSDTASPVLSPSSWFTCFGCGEEGHRIHAHTCPTRSKQCPFCHWYGHREMFCNTKKQSRAVSTYPKCQLCVVSFSHSGHGQC